jgi:hypothetical protein
MGRIQETIMSKLTTLWYRYGSLALLAWAIIDSTWATKK